MGRRHWLDPLARQLLVATGQIPPPAPSGRPPGRAPAPSRPGRTVPEAPGNPEPGAADLAEQESIECDLLALKLRQDPARPLQNADEVRRAAALGWRLDVNRATAPDWSRLPGIRPAQVDLLLRLQAGGVQLSGPEDLHQALEWPAERIAAWLPVLVFRWYGDAPPGEAPAPVDVNRAGAGGLAALGLSPEQLRRLQRERARGPFRDLAELQERLQLPSSLVERWIGRVRFSDGPTGPLLPPAPGRGT